MDPTRGAESLLAGEQSVRHERAHGPVRARAHLHNLERLLPEARPRFVRVARAYGVEPDAAEDAAQETLLVAWRRWERLFSTERLDPWLNGICHHVAQHAIRSSQQWARQTVPFAGSAQEGDEILPEGS